MYDGEATHLPELSAKWMSCDVTAGRSVLDMSGAVVLSVNKSGVEKGH